MSALLHGGRCRSSQLPIGVEEFLDVVDHGVEVVPQHARLAAPEGNDLVVNLEGGNHVDDHGEENGGGQKRHRNAEEDLPGITEDGINEFLSKLQPRELDYDALFALIKKEYDDAVELEAVGEGKTTVKISARGCKSVTIEVTVEEAEDDE